MKTLETLQIEPSRPATHCMIWLHGLGADNLDFHPLCEELPINQTHSIRYILPNAPIRNVTINDCMSMRAWYDISSWDLIREVDSEGIRESSALVQQLIAEQIELGIPAKNIFLAGFSQGGVIALWSGLQGSSALAGVIGLSTYLPLINQVKITNPQLPIFLAHGLMDPVVAITYAWQTKSNLEHLKMNLVWKSYPMLHQVCPEEVMDINDWIEKTIQNSQ